MNLWMKHGGRLQVTCKRKLNIREEEVLRDILSFYDWHINYGENISRHDLADRLDNYYGKVIANNPNARKASYILKQMEILGA